MNRTPPAPLSMLVIALILLPFTSLSAQDQQQDDRGRGWPCDRKIDKTYIEITEGSGGQLHMLQPSELSGMSILLESRMKGNEEAIFRASGEMSEPKKVEIPVDRTIESMTLSAFVQCMGKISIYKPDGSEVLQGTGGMKDHRFISGRILVAAAPEPGIWKIEIEGKGYFSVTAEAKTDLAMDVAFVRYGGRPGHEGYFPLEGSPERGKTSMISIELEGTVQKPEFFLLARDGSQIHKLNLKRVEGDDSMMDYLGEVTLDVDKFRVIMLARDTEGNVISRFDPRLLNTAANSGN